MAAKMWNIQKEVSVSLNETALQILDKCNGKNNLSTIAMIIYKDHYEPRETDLFKQLTNSNAFTSIQYDVLGFLMNLLKFDMLELKLNPVLSERKESEEDKFYQSPLAKILLRVLRREQLPYSKISEVLPEILKKEGNEVELYPDILNTEIANLLLKGKIVTICSTERIEK